MNAQERPKGETTAKRVGAALAGADVWSPDGHRVPLASLWEVRPVVLAFVRHFG